MMRGYDDMKKIMTVLLAALMMMSLASCTQDQAGNDGGHNRCVTRNICI